MHDIAIKLNDEGLKLKRSTFNGAVISYILKNPAYTGNYIVNRHIYGDSSRGAGTRRTGVMKPESEAITFPIPAIISKTEWDMIQEATQRNKVKSKHKGEFTDSFFLRNVCRCEVCGGKMNARIGNKRKDGSVLRYYNCYWAGTSKKNIEGGRHHKCSLPNVPADIVEREVWNRILMMFSYNPKETAVLYSDNNLTSLIKDAKKAIESLQKDVQTKKKARERLYRLTEAENCDLEELTKKLRINKDELMTLESRLADQENRLKELEESEQKVTERNEFMKDNRQNLKILRQEINSLQPADKKTLVEAMLSGPVTVGIREADPNHPEDGAGFVVDFRLRFNPDILNRFKDEGKILKLNSDSRDYHASSYSRGSP